MTEIAIITRRNGARTPSVQALEVRSAEAEGLAVLQTLDHGTVVEGGSDALDALSARGFRVKRLPGAHLIRFFDYTIDTRAPLAEADLPSTLTLSEEEAEDWTHHLIALNGPITPEAVAMLEATGLDVVEPVSTTAVLAVGPADAVRAAAESPAVRWTGPMQPAFRLQPALLEREGPVRFVRVGVYPGDALEAVKEEITRLRGRVEREKPAAEEITGDYAELIAEVDASQLSTLAHGSNVRFIEFASPEPGFDGEREVQILTENLDAAGAAPVTGYQAWMADQGLDGAGVTIAICDTGVDTGANNNTTGHTDLRGRQAAFIDYTSGATPTDTDGHGTHVASIAVGNAATGETEGAAPNDFLWGQGVAPAARYVTQNALFGPWPPANWGTLTADAVQNGAEIMNNSWWDLGGVGIGYTASSRTFDMLVRDPDTTAPGNQNLTIVFSAGNSGSNASTITSPKESKNIIAVGNSLTVRPGGDDDDIDGLRGSSSRGPALDGRIMPTVCAPGTNVSAALSASSARAAIAGTGSPDPMNPGNTIDQYLSISGTSMAAPHVAGACALLLDWWRAQTAGADPSPAMMKAMLINGAEDMAGGIRVSSINGSGGTGTIASLPNNDQGWGRVSVENMLLQAPVSDRGPRVLVDQTTAFTAAGQEYRIRVAPVDTSRPMRITLVWTDAPGAANANPALVNDLDLEVTRGSDTWIGNVNFQNGFSEPAGVAAAADGINNVECVYIQNPTAGVFEVAVIASVITANARPPYDMLSPWQDFALVIDNAEVEAADPVSIVPVIDLSGSMQTNGYVDATRTATTQFVDLMGVDDRLGIVGFSDAASDVYAPSGAMATITGAATRTAANAAVQGAGFGGCTFMGDGIQRAGTLLAPETNDRAMVLLSDGYDNKGCDSFNAAKPSAMDAANALPANLPIYACAMGPASDQALLETLANTTGGRYYFMPTIFDLFEIYNFIRGQVTGDGVAANESATASRSQVRGCVEGGAEYALFTVAWHAEGLGWVGQSPTRASEISVRLRDPSGRLLPAHSSLIRRVEGEGYVGFQVFEPKAGEWTIEVETARRYHTRYTAAIFVRSGLSLDLMLDPSSIYAGGNLGFALDILERGEKVERFSPRATLQRPIGDLDAVLRAYGSQISRIDPDDAAIADGIDKRVAQLMAYQAQIARKGGDDGLRPRPEPIAIGKAARTLDPRPFDRHLTSRFADPFGGLTVQPGVRPILQPAAMRRATSEPAFSVSAELAAQVAAQGQIGIANRGGLMIDRRLAPDKLFGRIGGILPGDARLRGQAALKTGGSHSVFVTVTGVMPSTGTRFCRRAMASAYVREG